jgi:hypothetical protein
MKRIGFTSKDGYCAGGAGRATGEIVLHALAGLDDPPCAPP